MPTTSKYEWHLYVLELEDDYWYVGISTWVEKRFRKHCRTSPKRCATLFTWTHKPIRIAETYSLGTNIDAEAAKFEKVKAVEVAAKYGYDKVSGGGHQCGSVHLKRAVERLQLPCLP